VHHVHRRRPRDRAGTRARLRRYASAHPRQLVEVGIAAAGACRPAG
jgi:hypothetical protein